MPGEEDEAQICAESPLAPYALARDAAKLRRFGQAIASYDRAIALKPAYAEAHSERGIALLALRRPAEALASCIKAIALMPGQASCWANLARVFNGLRAHDLAMGAYAKAAALAPDSPLLRGNLLQQKMLCCDWDGVDALVDAVERDIAAGRKAVHPFCWQAISSSPRSLQRAAERFADKASVAPAPPARSRNRTRIRVGYVSGEFRDQATALLLVGVLEHHDRSRFEVIGFDNGWDDGSPTRARIVAAVPDIVSIRALDDGQAAEVVRNHGIDVLVNLNGYFGEERNALFARRPAPIQVNYLGFPGTMGAHFIDYIIADAIVLPEPDRSFYAEKVVHLPDSYQANDRSRAIGDRRFSRTECGLPDEGFVFCCFNNGYKIVPQTFDCWIRILDRVDRSVLWLLEDSATASANLRKHAAARGLAPERLVFTPRLPVLDHLARHRCADLFLDTLPCNAHTTASDALWSGLPVLTCLGGTFAGRVAASLLRAVDLPELVVETPAEYEQLAILLATDPAALRRVRRRLHDNRLTTPLFDTARFTRHLESAFTAMHHRHCAGLPPDHIVIRDSAEIA